MGVYHDFETDQGSIDTGDASLGKVDTEKLWLFGEVTF